MRALVGYGWPGNIRELRNVVELVCLLREGKPVRVADLPEAFRQFERESEPTATDEIAIRLDRSLDEIVSMVLEATLRLEKGNRSRTARRLGVSIRTIQRFAARGRIHAKGTM